MRRCGNLFDLVARHWFTRRFRRSLMLVGCLLVGCAVAGALHWSTGGAAKAPLASAVNHLHLMRSMIAHARLTQGSVPLSMISGLANKLKEGSLAPTFTLPTTADHGEVSLSSLRGKPVVLVFGSLSCDMFCDRIRDIERMYQAYKDRAAFLFVCVTEAGHQIEGLEIVNDLAGPDTLEERRARVGEGLRRAGMTVPGALDVAESVETAYDAYPNRLVVVDSHGMIALDAGRALFLNRWDLGKVETWLEAQVRPAGD